METHGLVMCGLVHTQKKNLASFIHPHDILNLYDFYSFVERLWICFLMYQKHTIVKKYTLEYF